MHDSHHQYPLFSFPLFVSYIKNLPVTSLSLYFSQERSVVILTTAAGGEVCHFSPRWTNDELRTISTSSVSAAPARWRSRPRCLATLDREMCLCVSSSAWPRLSVLWLHFLSHLPRGTSALDWLQHLSSSQQSIMGRKKIQIQRITDERNKQVRLNYLFGCSFNLLKWVIEETADWTSVHLSVCNTVIHIRFLKHAAPAWALTSRVKALFQNKVLVFVTFGSDSACAEIYARSTNSNVILKAYFSAKSTKKEDTFFHINGAELSAS